MSPRRRHLLAALASALLFLAGLEAALRLLADRVGPRLGNAVYSAYDTSPTGMYVWDPTTRMRHLRRDFTTRASWNGYRWTHRSDELGFRNPAGLARRVAGEAVVLLGDSMIYGHGVEEEQTVAAELRRRGRPAYSMARQGDCLVQQATVLRLFGERLAPREVVLFVFANDIHDLFVHRTVAELAAAPEAAEGPVDRRVVAEVERRMERRRLLTWRQLERSRALRLLRALAADPRALLPAAPAVDEGDREERAPELVAAVLDPARFRIATDYYRRVVPALERRCRRGGATLRLVHLEIPSPAAQGRADRRVGRFLRRLARQEGIPFASTRGLFDDCPHCFLAGDGHFSPAGHRRLATFLDRRVLPAAGGGPR